jgi:carboxypeptidase family protein
MNYLENRQSHATIVVMLRDELRPDRTAIGDLFLRAPGTRRMPLPHASGSLILRDVPDGKHAMIAGGAYYQEQNFTIDTKTLDRARPIVEIPLKPGPRYTFPDGITVLKGKIIDAEEGKPLANTVVRISGRTERTVSDAQGAYLIVFPATAGDLNVTVQARAAGYRTLSASVALAKGKTRFLPLRIIRS